MPSLLTSGGLMLSKWWTIRSSWQEKSAKQFYSQRDKLSSLAGPRCLLGPQRKLTITDTSRSARSPPARAVDTLVLFIFIALLTLCKHRWKKKKEAFTNNFYPQQEKTCGFLTGSALGTRHVTTEAGGYVLLLVGDALSRRTRGLFCFMPKQLCGYKKKNVTQDTHELLEL